MGVNPSRASKSHRTQGQAIVEFAITLPLLLILLVGILEFGRMVFIYAVLTNASREAARYGSAIGFEDTNKTGGNYYLKYQYCAGIRKVAKDYGFLLNLQDSNIVVEYVHDTSATGFHTCSGTNDTTANVAMGKDRVKVTVNVTYTPMVVLFPISQKNFQSINYRTIAGNVNLYP